MSKIIELKIKNNEIIYQELAQALVSYRKKPIGSIMFIVEGTRKNPIIGIRYPGKKLKKRALKRITKNSAQWANLFDFEVVPYRKKKEISGEFTFEKILRDFQKNKIKNKKFWKLIKEMYYNNKISEDPSVLPGINPKLFLLVIKWIWIQEDFNYKFNWKDVNSSVRYVLETRTGSRTARGAGRAKFFAALILLKEHFTFEQVKKIIPLY